MGIDVYIESETGEKIAELLDEKGIVARLMPTDNARFLLLRYVDPYGNTVFNRKQMEQILVELEQIKRVSRASEEIERVLQLADMARRCQSEPHLYLKFYGD